jgi:hypothetical protein
MTINKMEKIKLYCDIGVTIFGLLAALFAVLSLIYNSKLEYVKQIEEDRLKSKIAESNAFAEKAKESAAHALASAANTNEKAKKLELKVEEQKERAANAEKELIILKDKIKPRSIPSETANKLVIELKKIANKEISISSSLGDGEAASYADQFKKIFEYSGWKVNSGVGLSTYTGIGIYLITKNKHNEKASEIKKILTLCGINIHEEIISDGSDLQIFIGSKNSNAIESN